MGKSASPVRLQSELMDAAKTYGELLHRSAAEQIEQWADLGRTLAPRLSPQDILEITAGIATLRVERTVSKPVASETVFSNLEARRASGTLARQISASAVRYQASRRHPGRLEQISASGEIRVGRFVDGTFIAEN
ncbi:hypothetical protein B5T_00142 [Alloalcanivorax dieselolei B5]|uniref:ParD-like antitoxin of type II toxin-antitoxin system n=1 Tax=Alcanivorax dieselolei (strain DSM 16502 / CGMCC 1.3690 / MCCC 1A00001 / B-5) TaxID=930169 RepID=K0C7G1_ALCDB|nr:hypothetical protein [Alloalcanivorax dieselolei]AFT68430.1 hypothetical protein B5T_00142 [Alloalcanivorax dieselolei B5]GGJ99748.1 hypothetical protein GCM10007426_31090 [Alloalcanivorax dieselolei]